MFPGAITLQKHLYATGVLLRKGYMSFLRNISLFPSVSNWIKPTAKCCHQNWSTFFPELSVSNIKHPSLFIFHFQNSSILRPHHKSQELISACGNFVFFRVFIRMSTIFEQTRGCPCVAKLWGDLRSSMPLLRHAPGRLI